MIAADEASEAMELAEIANTFNRATEQQFWNSINRWKSKQNNGEILHKIVHEGVNFRMLKCSCTRVLTSSDRL